MKRGMLLWRVARSLCSTERCANVLEPSIADLQRDPRRFAGYPAVWISFGACIAGDLCAPPARTFLAGAAAAFFAMLAFCAAVETLAMHSALREPVLVWITPYVGWYARASSATLMWAVPLAIAPALVYGRRQSADFSGATGVVAALAALAVTLVSVGWIAPAIERAGIIRQYETFAAATQARYAVEPLDVNLDRSSTAKSLPALIRGALAPPAHRFPGYPNYVAPEDQFAHDAHWLDLRLRLFVFGLAVLSAIVGLRARSLSLTIPRERPPGR